MRSKDISHLESILTENFIWNNASNVVASSKKKTILWTLVTQIEIINYKTFHNGHDVIIRTHNEIEPINSETMFLCAYLSEDEKK